MDLASNHGFPAHELMTSRGLIHSNLEELLRYGMSIAVSVDPRVKSVSVTDDLITFNLVDGRIVSVPLAWSWRLAEATPKQRARFEIIGDGQGAHWPDVDEDLSAQGMLTGIPARRPRMDNVLEARNLDV
ncbi:MAG: DUF2442 domain-containing protein [Thermoanaerobaculia bacterium]